MNTSYLFELETLPEYSYGVHRVDQKHRAILIDWLCEVSNMFKMSKLTILVAVSILDAYTSIVKIDKEELQLIGCVSLHLATQVSEMYTAEISDYVYVSDGAFTEDQFIQTVSEVFRIIGGRLIRPAPILFLKQTQENFWLAYIALFCDLHEYKPSLVAETINYLNIEHYQPQNVPDQVCKKITSVIQKGAKSSLKTFKAACDGVLNYIKKECPSNLHKLNIQRIDGLNTLPELSIFKTPYKKVKVLGEGVGGEVFEILKGDKPYAVKFIKTNVYLEEVAILQLLKSSTSIIRLEGILPEGEGCFMFLELGSYSLSSLDGLRKVSGKPEHKVLKYFNQMLEGVKYCHHYDVIHCDLKPDNIVWFESQKRFKLIDMGLSTGLTSIKSVLRSVVQTAHYRAPEVFLSYGKYDHKIDIWSMGCILFFMVTQTNIIKPNQYDKIFKTIWEFSGAVTEKEWPGLKDLIGYNDYFTYKGEKIKYHANYSIFEEIPKNMNKCHAIIKACLIANPKNRPSASALLGCI